MDEWRELDEQLQRSRELLSAAETDENVESVAFEPSGGWLNTEESFGKSPLETRRGTRNTKSVDIDQLRQRLEAAREQLERLQRSQLSEQLLSTSEKSASDSREGEPSERSFENVIPRSLTEEHGIKVIATMIFIDLLSTRGTSHWVKVEQ